MGPNEEKFCRMVWKYGNKKEREILYKCAKDVAEARVPTDLHLIGLKAMRQEAESAEEGTAIKPADRHPNGKKKKRKFSAVLGKFTWGGEVYNSLKHFCAVHKIDYPTARDFKLQGLSNDDVVAQTEKAMKAQMN